jgi:hypothetical protein
VIHVRNTHPTRTFYLPHSLGWERVLRPAATTMLSSAVLSLPAVRRALSRQDIAVVTEINRGNSAQERLRQDMALAIAAAEARERARLGQGVRLRKKRAKQRHGWWTPERRATFERLWRTGASLDAIATACQLNRSSVLATGYRLGLPPRRHPAADIARSQRWNSGSSVGWADMPRRQHYWSAERIEQCGLVSWPGDDEGACVRVRSVPAGDRPSGATSRSANGPQTTWRSPARYGASGGRRVAFSWSS